LDLIFFNKGKKKNPHGMARSSDVDRKVTETEGTHSELLPGAQSPVLGDKTDVYMRSESMIPLIGYRFTATGVFGYRFYTTRDTICSVSSIVAPSAPVMIHGNGVTWKSDFEDCTIVPGLTRVIMDESNGEPLFRIVYKERGKYEINASTVVYCDEGKYEFYCNDKWIAIIIRTNDKSAHLHKPSDTYYDYEPYFDVAADNGIDTSLLMAILAFPMLQFAL